MTSTNIDPHEQWWVHSIIGAYIWLANIIMFIHTWKVKPRWFILNDILFSKHQNLGVLNHIEFEKYLTTYM